MDVQPFVTGDGQELWFASSRPVVTGKLHLWRSVRTGGGFASPEMVTELTTSEEHAPLLSADRKTVYFSAPNAAPDAKGGLDVWRAQRDTTSGTFTAPRVVAELATSANDYVTWISPDHCRIYGYSGEFTANSQIFVATRMP